MKKTVSLTENRDFLRLYRSGKSSVSDCLVLYYKKNNLGFNRLGITCTKKVGKAVVRNRIRRRIRESYRELEDIIGVSYDFVVVARIKAASCDYRKICSAMKYLIVKSSLTEKI